MSARCNPKIAKYKATYKSSEKFRILIRLYRNFIIVYFKSSVCHVFSYKRQKKTKKF